MITCKNYTMHSSKYEYVNLEVINDIAGDDEDFVKEIISNYLESVPKTVEQLVQAVSAGDKERIVFLAHKAKGSFTFIGVNKLRDIAIEIEHSPERGSELEPLAIELAALSKKVDAELQQIVDGD